MREAQVRQDLFPRRGAELRQAVLDHLEYPADVLRVVIVTNLNKNLIIG